MIKARVLSHVAMVLALAAVHVSTVGTAHAMEETDRNLEELSALNPGMSAAELWDQAQDLAPQFGVTPEEMVALQLDEARDSAAAARRASESFATDPSQVVPLSGGGQGVSFVPLPEADRKGDLFIAPSWTLGYDHGHAGIYAGRYTIVHAPGPGSTSTKQTASTVWTPSGTVLMYVDTSKANRDAAAHYAYHNMQGVPYNHNFANNKYVPASSYNCSQLVWGAYRITTGIDLDGNGGPGVYPYNIKDSSLTISYRTL